MEDEVVKTLEACQERRVLTPAERLRHAYCELVELAELQDDELLGTMEQNEERAVEVILRYGSYRDSARAMRLVAQIAALGGGHAESDASVG